MRNYTKKGTNAENFKQISLLLKIIWYLKDSRNGHFAMHYSSFRCVGITYISQSDACVVGNTGSKNRAVIPT